MNDWAAERRKARRSVLEETRWLHVVCGGRDWLLPGSPLKFLIRRPHVQSIPAHTRFHGLVVHHNGIYPAIELSEILGGGSKTSPSHSEWGILTGGNGEPVFLLVEDHLGIEKIRPEEIEWVQDVDDEESCFLGTWSRNGRRLTLVDPLRLKGLLPKPVVESERQFNNLGVSGAKGHDAFDDEPRRTMLIVEDARSRYALPARDVFNVARVLESSGTDLFFLREATSGETGDRTAVSESKTIHAFECELRRGHEVMKIAFTDLICWLDVRKREIRPWTGMESFHFAGALRLPDENRTVMVVDVDRLMAGRPDRLAREVLSTGSDPAGGNEVMKGEKTERLVKIRAGKALAALPLSSLFMIHSLRRAKIHLISATNRIVTGLMERDGEFLTIVDLGLLLSMEATGTCPENRLLDVRTRSGQIALLAEQIFEPVDVKPEDIVASESTGTEAAKAGFVESVWRQEGGASIPVLNLDRLVLSLKDPVIHGL